MSITDVLQVDELKLILLQISDARQIAQVATTCHAFHDAVKPALALRSFSGEITSASAMGGAKLLRRIRVKGAYPADINGAYTISGIANGAPLYKHTTPPPTRPGPPTAARR